MILENPANPETLLISSVLQTGDYASPAQAGITPEFFHSYRPEWEWVTKFVTRHNKSPDKSTFRAQFPDFRLLKSTDVEHGCEEVRRSHLRHELTKSLKQATRLLVADRPQDALNQIQAEISGINKHSEREVANILADYSDVFQEAARRAEMATTRGLPGINTGYVTLNERIGGWQPGQLGIIAARLGLGKSWTLVQMTVAALLSGKKVAFVSLEQPISEIVFRVHTLLAKEFGYSIRHSSLMTGRNLDLRDYKGFLADLPSKVTGELSVYDPSTRRKVTPFTLAGIADSTEPDIIFLDYLTLMQKESDEWQGVAKLSAETKQVALQCGLPIVAAAQINRLGEGGKRPPSVDKLSQSDSIGQDADIVVTMRKFSNKARQMLLAKHRSGMDDILFYSAFDPDNGHLGEITYEEAMRLSAEAALEDDDE